VPLPVIRQIGTALRNLNPNEVRALAERPVTFGVLAADEAIAGEIFRCLIPRDSSEAQMRRAGRQIVRVATETDFARCDLGFAESGVPHPANFFRFDPMDRKGSIEALLEGRADDGVPLARVFPGLRDVVIDRIVWKISKENAVFTVATAVPNIIPTVAMIPWAAGEFASDAAFLTMNQVRMAFLIAAASDGEVGYADQKGQIGSIVAAAFGWRALARELVGKIPLGGGLVSKGLVSFAGTYVVGKSLERYFRIGRRLTRKERRQFYTEAFEKGRSAVEKIVRRNNRHSAAAPSGA
jgi:hypothetical protein